MTEEPPSIVIVEDDFLIAEDLRALCEEFGGRVLDVLDAGEGAAARILELSPSHVLMDVRLGGARDGIEVAQEVLTASPETRLIFITGSNEPPTIHRIEDSRPWRLLIKPIAPGELREALGLQSRPDLA